MSFYHIPYSYLQPNMVRTNIPIAGKSTYFITMFLEYT